MKKAEEWATIIALVMAEQQELDEDKLFEAMQTSVRFIQCDALEAAAIVVSYNQDVPIRELIADLKRRPVE